MALRFFHPFLLEYYRYLIQIFQRNEIAFNNFLFECRNARRIIFVEFSFSNIIGIKFFWRNERENRLVFNNFLFILT